MYRWRLTVVLALVIMVTSSSSALARNYDSPPPLDQIKPGDTLDYGDADVKVFRMEGRAPGGGVTILGGYFDGDVFGATDIWFVYNDPFGANSGPYGYGVTEVKTASEVDLVRAYTKLYDQPFGSSYWYLKDSAIAERYNDNTSGEAWVQYLHYTYLAPATIGFMATTSHKVQDAELGWNKTFSTSDSF
ncbi:MAG: hypothetical protein AB1700_03780 [Bacillota bacterium]